jgi:predicted RNA-binding Zn ribbon-like protein
MATEFRIIERRFAARDIIGGDAALDFINTVNGRDQTPSDWLDSYTRLLEWAELVHLLPKKALGVLGRKVQNERAAAAAALTRAKLLREALFALVTGLIAGKAPPKNALAVLQEHWMNGVDLHELRFDAGRVVPLLRNDAIELDSIAALVAYRMVEYVLPLPTDRLRLCAGTNCAWVFIDSSKAGRRRWCDMAVCGNAAKTRRFQARAH